MGTAQTAGQNNSSQGIHVRNASLEDAGTVLGFIRELAAYEKRAGEVRITCEDIRRHLFEEKTAQAVIADIQGKDIGFAVFLYHFSTFAGRPVLYIEDLFVRKGHRKKGVGRALLRFLAGIAAQKGCHGMEWTVLDWNSSSISFYQKTGARPKDPWTLYRLDEKRMLRMASGP